MTVLNRSQFPGDPAGIPPEYGTQPIPEGMVRFHHYTQQAENLPKIAREGLLERYAQESYEHGGSEAPVTFATAGAPSMDFRHTQDYVEGWADPSRDGQLDIGENWRGSDPEEHARHLESGRQTITFRGDIPPEQIIATHEPWHEHARYMAHEGIGRQEDPKDPYATGSMRLAATRGEYDNLEDDPRLARTYGPAIKSVKITNAATVMLGGKL